MIGSIQEYIRTPLLYNHWYVAGTVDDFTRQPVARTLLERSIVFFRTEAGQLRAFQNRCLHRSYPLSESTVDGDNLTCSYHGVCYGPDGVVVRIPSQAAAPVPRRQLKRYTVEERGPLVFIWMGDGEADYSRFPDIPPLGNPAFKVLHGFFEIQGSYLFMLENLYDLTHFVFLHRTTFKVPESFFDNPPAVTETADGLICCTNPEDRREAILKPLPPAVRDELTGVTVTQRDDSVAIAPGIVRAHIYVMRDGENEPHDENPCMYMAHFMTPVTKDRTLYWWTSSVNRGLDDDAHFAKIVDVSTIAFTEDVRAVEHMQRLLDEDSTEFREMNIAGDKAGTLFRRVILRWARDEYGAAAGADPSADPIPT
jgi:phenylpropionate dioxygenase-like ring-hydroxylating dioxygenase large terminal subunit